MIDFVLLLWLWRDPILLQYAYSAGAPPPEEPPSKEKPDCRTSYSVPYGESGRLRLCISADGMWLIEEPQ